MNKPRTFLAILAGVMLSAVAAADIHLPAPQLETLPNGLTLAWFVSDSLPVVDLTLIFRSGSRDDLPGKSGTASLLSALLDRGSAGMSAPEFAHAVEMLGASRYASADDDTITMGMHGLAPDAPVLLGLLAKMALHPDLPPAEVTREHDRMVDRWNHMPDYGESLVTVLFHRLLTAGTTYNRSGFASIREFAHVGRAELADFHRRHFTPKNAVLMVVGRVDQTAIRAQARLLLGETAAWSGEAPVHQWHKDRDARLPRDPLHKVVIVDRPKLTQAEVRLGFPVPLIRAPEHYSMTVVNALLGEYFNSRLNLLIRDQLGLTYGISSSISYERDFAALTIGAATRNEATGSLIQRTLGVLKDLKKGPLPADEVRTAKEYLIGGYPLGVSTLGAVASRWLWGHLFDLGPDYLNEFVPKVRGVTADQALAAVIKDFDLDHLVITVAGDAREISKSLDEAKLTHVKVDVKQLM